MIKIFKILILSLIIIFGTQQAKAGTNETIGSKFASGHTDPNHLRFNPEMVYNSKPLVLSCKSSVFLRTSDKSDKSNLNGDKILTQRELKLANNCTLRNRVFKENLKFHDTPFNNKQIINKECDLEIQVNANWSLINAESYTENKISYIKYNISISRDGSSGKIVEFICESSQTIDNVQKTFNSLGLLRFSQQDKNPIELPLPNYVKPELENHDKTVELPDGKTDT